MNSGNFRPCQKLLSFESLNIFTIQIMIVTKTLPIMRFHILFFEHNYNECLLGFLKLNGVFKINLILLYVFEKEVIFYFLCYPAIDICSIGDMLDSNPST